eukprot:TRINITY_DN16078_c0_g1_i1.p1 TRINITY_DN16078_c0_g1~~TRINITY_DN16078_c0_g1_i1.p1  ORF type:complete len:101 (+),score=0.23 TRINITY_DN16078_c0_g1_i1:690-992(+)
MTTEFFCNQVFFENDPSSSTSLLSSVGITTRKSSEREGGNTGYHTTNVLPQTRVIMLGPYGAHQHVTPSYTMILQCSGGSFSAKLDIMLKLSGFYSCPNL